MEKDRGSGGTDRGGDGGGLTRRRMVKLAVGAAIAVPLADLAGVPGALARAADGAKAPGFLTKDELALLDELTEIIIPTDEHSAGARAAGVAAYLDRQLAETWEPGEQESWRAGLKAIDALSVKTSGKPFLQSTPDARVALLTGVAKNELDPKTPEETFFRQLKGATAYVYYTSEIGLHKDIGYLGNSYLDEFVGYDVSVEDEPQK